MSGTPKTQYHVLPVTQSHGMLLQTEDSSMVIMSRCLVFDLQQSTYEFKLLSGPTPAARNPDGGQSNVTYYDSE